MSNLILPLDPSQTTGINSDETQRFNFLSRFLNNPCLFSVVLCIRDYLNSSLSGTANYKYGFVSKVWKKEPSAGSGYAIHNFSPAELFVMVSNYEGSASFCGDCVHVILADCQYNIDTQEAIYDNPASTEQEKADALKAKFQFTAMKNNLDDYRTKFLNYQTMMSEVIPTLEVLMAEDA